MLLKWASQILATCVVGRIPWAPGTMGSLLAVVLWWYFPIDWLAIVVVFFVGWLATHYYEKFYQKHDPKEVVIDEVVGQWIALYGASHSAFAAISGFLLFRLFDIWKPFPVGWADRKIPGALGTLLDDVFAGIMAWGVLFLSHLIMERYGIGF